MTSLDPRQSYEKPELTVIEFSAEEVLAVGCKTAAGSASNKKPGPGCRLSNCFQVGS
jgi:hypothetical protein